MFAQQAVQHKQKMEWSTKDLLPLLRKLAVYRVSGSLPCALYRALGTQPLCRVPNIQMRVIDHNKLWNFIADNFFYLKILSTKIKFEFAKKLKIDFFLKYLGWGNNQMKVVDLENLWNFVVDNILI